MYVMTAQAQLKLKCLNKLNPHAEFKSLMQTCGDQCRNLLYWINGSTFEFTLYNVNSVVKLCFF